MGTPLLKTAQLGVVTLVLLSAAAAGAVAGAGDWRRPLGGDEDVVRPFDPPSAPWSPGHRGVDIRGRPGEVIRAAGPGVVGYAGLLAGRGVVTIRHTDGLETTYEPVAPLVAPGDRVAGGDAIGRLTGGHGACGPGYACLHWGLRRGPAYENPLDLLGGGPVRLLPVPARSRGTADPGAATRVGHPSHRGTTPASARRGVLAGGGAAAAAAVGVAAAVSRRRLGAR